MRIDRHNLGTFGRRDVVLNAEVSPAFFLKGDALRVGKLLPNSPLIAREPFHEDVGAIVRTVPESETAAMMAADGEMATYRSMSLQLSDFEKVRMTFAVRETMASSAGSRAMSSGGADRMMA